MMRFLTTVTLLTAAVVLISKAAKAQKFSKENTEDDDYGYDHLNTSRLSYENTSLYIEPSDLTIPERHEGAFDRDNRPEYASDNQPQLTVEALRRETNLD